MKRRGPIPRHEESIKALHSLLKEATREPQKYLTDAAFIGALKSQGALSKYRNPALGIIDSSINTLKRTAEANIEGGFTSLDSARKSAQAAVQQRIELAAKSNKSTKKGLHSRVTELDRELLISRQNSWQLTKLFHEALKQGHNYAAQSEKTSLMERCRREQRELLRSFSMCVTPNVSQND